VPRGAGEHPWAANGALRHEALFYRARSEYLEAVTAFLHACLDRGEPVLAAVPGERAGQIASALGWTTGAAEKVSFADMAVIGRNPAAIIPAIRTFADRHPGGRFGFVCEPAWPGRSAAELIEATKHEALVNLAFAGTGGTILCPYDAAALPASAVADARQTHPVVTEQGHRYGSGAYLGARLPPRCEQPLADPPPGADLLAYHTDLRPVRTLVAARATAAGLTEARASDLVLAVSEIAANTIRHTAGGGEVRVWTAAAEIVCEVRDHGWITDPLAGQLRPPAHPAGRQGLWVVNKLCDLVELRSGRSGTTVRLHMSVPG
jgi:anti-sigma regulatory factor (Ser/Thr protein kinase)